MQKSSLDPISPLPPITTIFMIVTSFRLGRPNSTKQTGYVPYRRHLTLVSSPVARDTWTLIVW